jgi:deoxyribodipyrimidine photo-lyase
MKHSLDSDFVREQLTLRASGENFASRRADGDFVLYWMQATHRLDENWALRLATLEADRLGKPLLIYQGLDPTYEHASDRIHSFILHNARELSARADELGLTYRFHLRRRRDDDRRVVDRLVRRAAVIVTDAMPTAGINARTRRMAERAEVRVIAVDSHGIVPTARFVKEEWAARTIRPKLAGARTRCLEPVEDRAPRMAFTPSLLASVDAEYHAMDWRTADISAEIAKCEIDHAVFPVATPAGATAARARLLEFCRDALVDYEDRRGEPTDTNGSSRLSAYLHFGQISAAEVARTAMEHGPAEPVEKFLDELITWRELSLNFCTMNAQYESIAGLPDWVKKNLAEHAADPREVTYTRDELERGATAYPLWNAAQRELVQTGAIHNVMRMYWGKCVIAWKATYEEAFADLVYLNDKWALDGRDPSSYGGIAWCFGKFDRPWVPKRPVYGMLRWMSLPRAYSKFDAKGYETRWLGTETQGSLF